MARIELHPLAMDGKDPSNLRGDSIPQERYYDREFMQQEWEHLWTKIWHLAGREQQLEEPGDYIVHDFMHESVLLCRECHYGLCSGPCSCRRSISICFGGSKTVHAEGIYTHNGQALSL